ncbi:2-dehydro-3-deoxygalactonokinase [Arenibacterium sp. LLYu02]|uniref:2-dehydro-3-deoxygalactonokinase n=1 Tax=Arenibacterium sp. LLYu02 TaxID=3404132 RepID=UPI003B2172EF
MDRATTATWVAWDSAHQPPRAWVVTPGQGASPAQSAPDLASAQALAPGADLLTFADFDTAAQPVPAKPAELAVTTDPAEPGLFRLPSLSQNRPLGRLTAAPCRIDGFLALNPNWDGVLCLPGHQQTDWVLVSAAEVVSFVSFATVPLLTALCPEALTGGELDAAQLTSSLEDVTSKPETLAQRLSEVRIAQAIGALTPEQSNARAWGAVLGAELAAARPYWLGQAVALLAPEGLVKPYQTALTAQYVPLTQTDEARMTLEGFLRARARQMRS